VLTGDDRTTLDAIPITTPARTIVDLAEVLTEQRLADAVHEAEVQRLFDLRKVEAALARASGRRGRHKLRRVVAAYGAGPPYTRNHAERLLFDTCLERGLPRPRCNVLVCGHQADFFWSDAALVVEFDGAATHLTRRAFHADRRRDRVLAAQGIQTVRMTWPDIDGDRRALASEGRRSSRRGCGDGTRRC
jgi:very-short-patch-repair endonuclease